MRELRAEARGRATYWLRVTGAAAATLSLGLFSVLQQGGIPGRLGAVLFHSLSEFLFWTNVIVVPLFTADCISRERREGTLSLLFLTPLSARDILIGKSIIHGLRAFNLMFGALPILGVPFVMGGVTFAAAAEAFFLNVFGLGLGLAAGLMASVRNTEWVRSAVYAELISIGLAVLLQPSALAAGRMGFMRAFRLASGSPLIPLVLSVLLGCLSVYFFAAILRNTERRLKAHWQDLEVEVGQPKWVSLFSSSDFWRSFFRWNTAPVLDRNPVMWLQEYSWTARLTKWGWCALILMSEFVLFVNWSYFREWQNQAPAALALGMAFSAAGSFRRERQSGALELLLVTPLRPFQIAFGRLWGVWCHFFPAVATFLVVYMFIPYGGHERRMTYAMFFFCSYLTLPVMGLLFSMLRLNFFVAWLATLAFGIILPMILGSLCETEHWAWIPSRFWARFAQVSIMCLIQLLVGAAAFHLLHRTLVRRSFVLHD